MIRFGVIVSIVVAAVGLLAVGAVAGELTLVYVSIALAAVALLMLIVGVAVWRDDVFASSARQDELDLAPGAAVGRTRRAADGAAAAEDWNEWSAPTTGHGPHGAEAAQFLAPNGAPPERESPAEEWDRRGAEPRPADRPLRPADRAGRPASEPGRRDRPSREPAVAEGLPREPAPAERADRAAEPVREDPAREREPVSADRSGRDAASGSEERAGRAAAAELGSRETGSARRTDRVDRYPTVAASEPFEPAEDPTRLAHRLDSLADVGRPTGPDVGASAPSPSGRPDAERRPSWPDAEPGARPADARYPVPDPLTASTVASPEPTGVWGTRAEDGPKAPSPAGDAPVALSAAGPTLILPGAPTIAGGGPDWPAEAGSRRLDAAAGRDDTRTSSAPGSSVWSRTPSGPDTPGRAESALREPSSPVFPTSPAPGPVAEPEDATPAKATAETIVAADAAASGTDPAGPADGGPSEPHSASDAGPELGADDEVSVVPGIARYHKADCILIRFLSDDDLEVITRRDAEATGCAPCRACRPDRPLANG